MSDPPARPQPRGWKYGLAIGLAALLLVALFAASPRPSRWIALWGALAAGIVSVSYLANRPTLIGKRPDGTRSPVVAVLLAPYLLYVTLVWHVVRLVSSEDPSNVVNERLIIGRRLLSSERPAGIDHVVDLTTEFTEPRGMRIGSYTSHPILDAHTPDADTLAEWVDAAAARDGLTYVHCGQGHGRAALFSAAMLIARGEAESAEEAMAKLKDVRPLVGLHAPQRRALEAYAARVRTRRNRS